MPWGLAKDSVTRVAYERKNTDKIIRYRIRVDILRRSDLLSEVAGLESLLDLQRPTDEELIEIGKGSEPFFTLDRVRTQERIDEIEAILET